MANLGHWQYQAKAEPQQQSVPRMDSWYHQEPDQVAGVQPLTAEQIVSDPLPPEVILAWLVVPPDLIRLQPRTLPGQFALVELVAPSIPDIDWIREHDVVRRLPVWSPALLTTFALVEIVGPPLPLGTGPGGESVQLDLDIVRMPDTVEAY